MTAPDITITLDEPIKRGNNEIKSFSLRKPSAGELRGVSLTDLLQMDVTALITVVPRISTPTLTGHEVGAMDPADLFKVGQEVSTFLLSKATRHLVSQIE